jgi:hypothetical protein
MEGNRLRISNHAPPRGRRSLGGLDYSSEQDVAGTGTSTLALARQVASVVEHRVGSNVSAVSIELDGELWEPVPGASVTAEEFITARSLIQEIHRSLWWNP